MASIKFKILIATLLSLLLVLSCSQTITVTGLSENSKDTVRISIEGNSLVSDKNIFSNSNNIPIYRVMDADSGSIEKSLSVPFGDISKGVFSKLTLPFNPNWKMCAIEGSVCEINGKSIMRYGERDVYVYKIVDSDFLCAHTVFGDPLWGVHKKCDVFDISDYLDNTSQAVTLQNFYGPENKRVYSSLFSSIRLVWTFCSHEHGTCNINRSSIVRYGQNNVFVYTYAKENVICNNDRFGDPLYGTFKKCDYIILDDLTNRGINLFNPLDNNESRNIFNNFNTSEPINWVYCSPEWGTCNISARSIVRYGENSSWRYIFTNTNVSCTNDFFGDPLYGTFKKCEFFVISSSKGNLSLNTSNWLSEPFGNSSNQIFRKINPFIQISWTNCANENEFCRFTGRAIVRYGKNNVFNYKIFENGQQCSNDRFGDPLYGIVKFCSYFIISNYNQENLTNLSAANWLRNIHDVDNNIYNSFIPPYNPEWRRCAGQNDICTVSKLSVVRYGAEPNFRFTLTSNSIVCTHLIFGDPFVGVNKDCNIHEVNLTPALLGNSATFNAPENWLSNSFLGRSFRNFTPPPHINVNWVRCSSEYQHCFPRRKSIVRYGERNVWTYKIVDDNISCNNEFFGDPLYGVIKVCDYFDLSRFTLNSVIGVTRLNLVPESWLSNQFVDRVYSSPWQQIEGKLKQISVGSDGRVWGVNSADDIFTRDGVNGNWQQIDGKLKQIAVGFDGRVWGVNSGDDIFTRMGVNGSWQHIPGKLKNITVAADGRVWGVNSSDQIFTRNGVNGEWQLIPGLLKSITASNNGSIWGVNSADDIFTRNGVDGDWIQIPGKLMNIGGASSVANKVFDEQELIWGVNMHGQIFAREGADGTWRLIPGGLVDIAIGKNGRVWGVNSNDDIFTRLGVNNDWQHIPGKLINIAVNSQGRVWGVNRNHDIFTRDGVNGEWVNIPGKLKNISVSEDGRVWGVNSSDDIFTRNGVDGDWQHIPGKLSHISVDAFGRVWGTNSSDSIFTRDGVNGEWQNIPGGLVKITAAPNGRVWGINRNGEIYTRNGVNGEWLMIPGRLSSISGCSSKISLERSGHNVVWGVNSANDIFVRDGADGSWKWIEGKLKNISVGLDGRVWGVNSNDDIFTREGFSNVFKNLNSPINIEWQRCSSEYQRCIINERSLIRYGERGVFVYKLMDTSFDCMNNLFGDPLYGIVKVCDFFPLSSLSKNKSTNLDENLNVLKLTTPTSNVLLVTKNQTEQFNLSLKDKMINIKAQVKNLKNTFTQLASELKVRVENLNRKINSNNDRTEAIKRRNTEIEELTRQIFQKNIVLRDSNEIIKNVEKSINNLNIRKNEISTKMNQVNSEITSTRNLIDNFKLSFDIAIKKESLLKEFEVNMNNIEIMQPYLNTQIATIIRQVRSKKYDALSVNSFFISPN